MQFDIASKARESNTKVIEYNVKNLMKSYISKTFLIVYAMNQILVNKENKTPDMDGILYKGSKDGKVKEGFQNATCLALKINYQFLKNYKCKPFKRTYNSKLDSSNFKPLDIPTIQDHTIQKMFQLVIDPAVDVFADTNSYGFRKHRSYHNTISSIANKFVKASKNLMIININIKKIFDSIDHKWIKENFPMPTDFKNVLNSWLSSGIFDGNSLYKNEYDVPQESIIPALIVNFALDGLETEAFKDITKSVIITKLRRKKVLYPNFGLVRYANDFVIITNHHRNLNLIKTNVKTFLSIRNLEINKEKSQNILFSHKLQKMKISSPKFDFLGFTFMYQSNVRPSRIVSRKDMTTFAQVIISPSRKSTIAFKKKLKKLISKNSNLTALQLLQKLNPILRN